LEFGKKVNKEESVKAEILRKVYRNLGLNKNKGKGRYFSRLL
jgi:hypothetical protein